MKASINRILFFAMLTACLSANSQSFSNKSPKRTVADTNLILPPSWAFGVLYGGYTNQQETVDQIKAIQEHDYPIDAYWIDSWFWSYADKGMGPHKFIDFIADTSSYPDRKTMWKFLQDNGIKGGFWSWDCIMETGNEEAFNQFKTKGYFSSIYNNTNTWHNRSSSTAMFKEGKEQKGTMCGNIDFDNPEAVSFFKQRMKHFFDEGADFIKLDRTSKISTSKAMFEMSQEFGKETKGRGFILAHSFDTGDEMYKRYPTKWTDDTRSDWSIEKPLIQFNPWVPPVAFKENIAMFTDPSKPSSRIPFLTNDLGGFDMGKTQKPEEELYIRWLQFSMFNPITEVFSQPENPTANMAWLYSARADSIFRYYAQWRMRLFPYIYSYALRSRVEGKHMLGKFPESIYQYTFGDEMLLAPVYEKSAETKTVLLPEGKWMNHWTGEVYEGKQTITVAAPLEQIPLFVKLGSIIPMRNYASSVEKGNNDTLMLHIYPGDRGSFNLLEDDGTSNDYLEGLYASTMIETKSEKNGVIVKINPLQGSYKGIKKTRKWIILIHSRKEPSTILFNNQKCEFKYNRKEKLITIENSPLPLGMSSTFKVKFQE